MESKVRKKNDWRKSDLQRDTRSQEKENYAKYNKENWRKYNKRIWQSLIFCWRFYRFFLVCYFKISDKSMTEMERWGKKKKKRFTLTATSIFDFHNSDYSLKSLIYSSSRPHPSSLHYPNKKETNTCTVKSHPLSKW